MADEDIIEQRAPGQVLPAPAPPRVVPEPVPEPLEYPDSDGHFLPDNPLQANAIVELRDSLNQHFLNVPNVVVEGDMFLYYAEGEADERRVLGRRVGKFVAPDVIVVLDHDLGDRRVYKVWEEGKPPDFALEVISPSSEVRNQVEKVELYERIGIREYFLFQPQEARPGPRVAGYQLRGGRYRRLQPDRSVPGAPEVRSEVLGVSLRAEGAFLRVRSLDTGKDYLWLREWSAEVVAAAETAEREKAARRRSDERAEREAAARRRSDERAEREAAARRKAEERLAALEARLRRSGELPRQDG